VEPLSDTLTAFTALADPTRRRIVDRLAHGSATVSELVAGFDLTQPTISSHLKVLEGAGLISRSRVAQTRPSGVSSPQSMRMVVVLPEPFGPRNP
jgi:DNA-binding transcriptional ArsR family regulator